LEGILNFERPARNALACEAGGSEAIPLIEVRLQGLFRSQRINTTPGMEGKISVFEGLN
jgi:hypothetical protein